MASVSLRDAGIEVMWVASAPVPSAQSQEVPAFYEDVHPFPNGGGTFFDEDYDARYPGCIVPPPKQGLHANGVWM